MSMIRRFTRLATPPIVWSVALRVRRSFVGKGLFGGDAGIFTTAMDGARVYFEYGVGQSTLWVDRNSEATIHAVDTSDVWIRTVSAKLRRPGHVLDHVDIGPLGDWGMPLSYARHAHFIDYVEGVWRHGALPDMVLVDGRCRIACFLTALLHAAPGCRIVFDDYVPRPNYAVVEEFLAPEKVGDRQALFVVPDERDMDRIKATRDRFILVFE